MHLINFNFFLSSIIFTYLSVFRIKAWLEIRATTGSEKKKLDLPHLPVKVLLMCIGSFIVEALICLFLPENNMNLGYHFFGLQGLVLYIYSVILVDKYTSHIASLGYDVGEETMTWNEIVQEIKKILTLR